MAAGIVEEGRFPPSEVVANGIVDCAPSQVGLESQGITAVNEIVELTKVGVAHLERRCVGQ